MSTAIAVTSERVKQAADVLEALETHRDLLDRPASDGASGYDNQRKNDALSVHMGRRMLW